MKFKKTVAGLACTAMAISCIPISHMTSISGSANMLTASAAATGQCGKNITYTLDDDGVLTISGTGEMDNFYSYVSSPFDGNNNIVSVIIENGVTSIGYDAFIGCMNIESISIPDSVTSIGGGAFYGCRSLMDISIPDSVTDIGESAFYDCVSLKRIEIPNSVTSIESSIFYNCEELKDIKIPDTVTYIGGDAFWGTKWIENKLEENPLVIINRILVDVSWNIENVVIPDTVKTIAGSAFRDNSYITNVTIPDSVTSIGNSAFRNCSNLTDINIPDSVTVIYYGAFALCSKLTNIYIPNSVTYIGGNAFYKTKWLENKQKESPYVVVNKILTDAVTSKGDAVVPDNVKEITECAFLYNTDITSVTIPDTVTCIRNDAFYGCSNLTDIYFDGTEKEWNSIYISSENEELSKATKHFSEIPATEPTTTTTSTTAEPLATTVTTKQTTTENAGSSGKCGENIFWTLSENGVLKISGTGEMDNYLADSKDDSLSSPFKNNNNIKSVIIENGITSIGSDLFLGCSNLTDISVPDSVKSIGSWAFSKTKWLENKQKESPFVVINGILIDGQTCKGEVIIPDTVKEINTTAFHYNKNITSVIIPDSTVSIGYSAFGFCSSLTNITIPDSVTSIGEYAFNRCTGLTSVKIPDSITSISNSAFSNCSNLKEVEISDSLKIIDDYAFVKCSNLTDIYYNGTENEWKNVQINRGNDVLQNAKINFTTGDINGDKKIDSKDAVLILKSYAETLAGKTSSVSLKKGDVNGDKKLDSKDAVIILRYYAAKLAGVYNGNIADFR